MITRLRIAVALVFVTVSFARAQDANTARMEQVIQSHVSAGTFMGTVLVARDGAVVLDKAYGMANLELDVANTTTTKFRLGSVTKQFTAASILLLEERGKLNVNDKVKAYLPDAPMAWDRITVFNLLTHTSGIPNFTALADYDTIKLSSRTAASAVTAIRDKTLDFGPGEKMSYSNSGYVVLGAIIEKVSGQSYEKFVQENIFTPLGMKDSGYDSNSAIIKRRASGYIKTPGGYANAGYIDMSIPHAAGALYSTTGDLLKWEQALFAGKVVSKVSLDRMITPFKNDYALGVTSTLDKGRRVIAHSGGIDGFNTYLAYYPETKTVIVALSNVNGPVPGAIAAQLGALMHGDAVTLTSERKEITLPAATLSKYVGVYRLGPGAVLTISLDGEGLTAKVGAQPNQRIFPQSETLFFLKAVDAQIEFAADASSLVLHQSGRDVKAPRQ
ncbi:MAG TPA: serine hydrolase [Vicinamibacterales bacterium]|nr:serine hydrolase [Vicinamibacterales bacterium]